MANPGSSGKGLLSVLTTPRHKPSIKIGLIIYFGYLLIFFTTWIVNKVDYTTIGNTVSSTMLHYALPTLIAGVFVAAAISYLGWWRITLFDKEKSGPKWAWLAPISMFVLAVMALMQMNAGNASAALVMWSILGAIGVGFGEEMITRGSLLVGLRSQMTEGRVWFYSTLAFSALHIPNVLFGLPLLAMPTQILLTFIAGSLLYSARRLSGTLLLPMILHGLWDSSAFLPKATGGTDFFPMFLLYPIAIVCAGAVIMQNRGKRLTEV